MLKLAKEANSIIVSPISTSSNYSWTELILGLAVRLSDSCDRAGQLRGSGAEDERAPNQRVRPGDGGVRGGGRGGSVRGGNIHGRPHEQDVGSDRGLPAHRLGHVRLRRVRGLVHGRGRGHHTRHAGPRRGRADGVQGDGPAGGGPLRHPAQARRRRPGRPHRGLQHRGGGVWLQFQWDV